MALVQRIALFLLFIVVAEACHSHHIHGRSKTLVKCKSKSRKGKMCYYYTKGKYAHNHEHTEGSYYSHEHDHPGGSDDSSDIVSSEEDIDTYGGEGSSSGGGGTIVVDYKTVKTNALGYVTVEKGSTIEETIGTCDDTCGAYELKVTLCPAGKTCKTTSNVDVDALEENKDGCKILKCADKNFKMIALAKDGNIAVPATNITCNSGCWYNHISEDEVVQFDKSLTFACLKI